MHTRIMSLVALVLSLVACSSELDTKVIVSAECANAPGATLHWAVTAGECGIRPGAVEFAGVVGEEAPPFVLDAGEYCVWALAVDASCRVLAGTSTDRTLPEGRGAVALTLDESTCIPQEDRSAWDLLVEASASCAPSCEPDRCDCNRASACSGARAYCPPPLRGDLLDSSATHTCVGQRGAVDVHCWSDGLPVLLETPSAVIELAVGPNMVCYLGPRAGMPRNTIYCSQAINGAFAGWLPVEHPCGDTASNLIPSNIEVGDGFVCAIADVSTATGIACWGDPPSGTLPGSTRTNCAIEAEEVVPGPVLFVAEAGERWETLAAGAGVLCALRDATIDCIGANAPEAQALVPEGQGIVGIEMSGYVLCLIATNGAVACTGPQIVPDDRQLLGFGVSSSEEGTTFCGVLPDGEIRCGPENPRVDFAAFSIAPETICGITPGLGRVSCVTTTGEPAAWGTNAATPTTSWVCPDE